MEIAEIAIMVFPSMFWVKPSCSAFFVAQRLPGYQRVVWCAADKRNQAGLRH